MHAKCVAIMIDNPFITFGYESADYFCDRKKETQELITLLTNGNHVALISPRRMGKTGLLNHCFAQSNIQQKYYTFLIDIYATKNLQDMVFQMGRSIVTRLKPRGQEAVDRFLKFVTSLRTGISFDGQGNASWNLSVGDIKSPSFTLEEIFNYLKAADKRCIVAIDEFQSIVDYPSKRGGFVADVCSRLSQSSICVFWFSEGNDERNVFFTCQTILPKHIILVSQAYSIVRI